MLKSRLDCVMLTTYLNTELFSLELEGQVLVVRKFTRQTVQMRYLAYMYQTCEKRWKHIKTEWAEQCKKAI